jgi:hypothetical protein
MGVGRVRTSRSSRRRGGLRRVCHPPIKSISSTTQPNTPSNGSSHTAGTLSLSACDEAASVVTLRRAEVRGEASALRRNGGAMLLRTALENMFGAVGGGGRKEGSARVEEEVVALVFRKAVP